LSFKFSTFAAGLTGNLRGIAWMALSTVAFSTMHAMVRDITQTLHPFEVAFAFVLSFGNHLVVCTGVFFLARAFGVGPDQAVLRDFFVLAAVILGFTRALGEFGATVTLAGNIPGRTQTLASAIYSAQQVGNDREAYVLLGIALVVGLVAILAAEHLSRPHPWTSDR